MFKINGKYVMICSVGSYRRPTYKIGVAYSDGFAGPYRKVRRADPDGVWGRPSANEVGYLLQPQKENWSHYARASAKAPGVGSLLRQGDSWYLFFAGYDPSEQLSGPKQVFTASHRRPYYLPVKVAIPDMPVAQASDAQLASWITP